VPFRKSFTPQTHTVPGFGLGPDLLTVVVVLVEVVVLVVVVVVVVVVIPNPSFAVPPSEGRLVGIAKQKYLVLVEISAVCIIYTYTCNIPASG